MKNVSLINLPMLKIMGYLQRISFHRYGNDHRPLILYEFFCRSPVVIRNFWILNKCGVNKLIRVRAICIKKSAADKAPRYPDALSSYVVGVIPISRVSQYGQTYEFGIGHRVRSDGETHSCDF